MPKVLSVCVIFYMCFNIVVGQFGFYPNHRGDYRGKNFERSFLSHANGMRQRVSGTLHVQNRDPYNEQYYPYNQRGESYEHYPYQQYPNYAYNEYGRPVRFPDNVHNPRNSPYEVIMYELPGTSAQDTDYFDPTKPVAFPVEDKTNNNPVESVETDNIYQPVSTEKTQTTLSSTERIDKLPNNPAEDRDSIFSRPVPNNNGFPTLIVDPNATSKSTTTSTPATVTDSTNSNPETPQMLTPAATEGQAFPTLNPVTESHENVFPKLTPVPETEKRNNFNFGSEGIFQETCQTVDGGIGSCLTVFSCQPYLALLQQSKSDPSVVQLLRKAHCGFEGNTPKVCCPARGIPTNPPPPATTTTTTTAAPATEPESRADHDVFPEPPVCGFSNASLSRVVGGVNAKLGDFPWMALLGYYSNRTRSSSWKCGGSIITANHILTAAHCIYGHETDLYVVRVGELDLEKENDGATPIDILIKSKIMHEEYSPNSFSNDIGILVLQRTIPFTDLIKPICIPRDNELRARSFENHTPIIAGWGDLKFMGPASPRLQALQLPVVSNEYCSQAFVKYTSLHIDDRVLCAGYKKGGKDACQGDSGGPLMQPIWNSQEFTTYFYQIGVVSFGKKCAEPGFPGVYTRVTHFVPWIEKTVRSTTQP